MRAERTQTVASVCKRLCASDSVRTPGNSLKNAPVFVLNVSKVPTVTGVAGVRGRDETVLCWVCMLAGPWLMALVKHLGPWWARAGHVQIW